MFARENIRLLPVVIGVLIGVALVAGFIPVTGNGLGHNSRGTYVITPFGAVQGRIIAGPSETEILASSISELPSGSAEMTPQGLHPDQPPGTYPPGEVWETPYAYVQWCYCPAVPPSLGEATTSFTLPSSPSLTDGVLYLEDWLGPTSSGGWPQLIVALQWGNNGYFGGSYWTMADWYESSSSSGVTIIFSSPMETSYSDISMQMIGYNCQSSNGECNWDLTAIQFQNGMGYTTSLNYGSTPQLKDLAMYDTQLLMQGTLHYCSSFPSNPSTTFSMGVYSQSGVYLTPSWSPWANGAWSGCGVGVSVGSPSSVTFHY
jgi:hypothetical protein